jgi:probable phosphoglycerate mutase
VVIEKDKGKARILILVRHSLPEIDPGRPAAGWPLSEEGRRRSRVLARRLAGYDLAAIVASQEPKATETGRIVAETLSLPFETAPDLHEHERQHEPFFASQEAFRARVVRLLEQPEAPIFGQETGDEAGRRFAAALKAVLAAHARGNLAVVTHGTVLALFLARAAGIDAVALWRRLGLPAFVVLSLPGYEVLEVVEEAGL